MDFNPTERINILLGPSTTDTWACLIPQVLLWCFRRFCIEKLMVFEGTLYESLWDDHLELVQRYCPKGLEKSIEWMTPENILTLHTSLELYNKFFVDFVIQLDIVIMGEDDAAQDEMSEFLDTKICSIISDWVSKKSLLIFPMNPKEDDEFLHMGKLIETLLDDVSAQIKPPPPPQPKPPQPKPKPQPLYRPNPEPLESPRLLLWRYLSKLERPEIYYLQKKPLQEVPWTPPVQEVPWTPPVQEVPWTPPVQEVPWTPPVQEVPWTTIVQEVPYTQPLPEIYTLDPIPPYVVAVGPPTAVWPWLPPTPEDLFNASQSKRKAQARAPFIRTLANAIAYRRTIRANHRIHLRNHGKTRKSHPAA